MFENIVMVVLGYDVFCVCLEGAVYKLIIIRICSNQTKMIVNLNHLGVGQVKQGFDDSRERYSLLLVWGAHVFVLPVLYHVVVEHTLVP